MWTSFQLPVKSLNFTSFPNITESFKVEICGYEGRFLCIGFDIVVGFEQTSSSIFDVTESILFDGVSARLSLFVDVL